MLGWVKSFRDKCCSIARGDRSETRGEKMLVMTFRDFTGEIDGSFDEAQFPMQTSKGAEFRDLLQVLEEVSPENRADDVLFPVKMTFGTTSTSLDQNEVDDTRVCFFEELQSYISQRFPVL